jgi:diguanylate cyclase (GGDEF)-like protein
MNTIGHATGDPELIETAEYIVKQLRGSDVVGRYGGEELAVFLPETPLAEGLLVAEKLRAAIQWLTTEPYGARSPGAPRCVTPA